MNTNKWDPLEETLSPELLSTTIKRQIKNILKSYTGWFDPLSELLQNALDTVDNRRKASSNYIPTIWIKIDLKNNLVCVTDNGEGFSEEQFKYFLAPNVSYKKQGNRGNKGVGATYLAYGFNYLQIGTKTKDYKYVGEIKDGRIWLEDETWTVTRPQVHESKPIHEVFESFDQGSTFCLIFRGDYIRPRDLTYVNATTADQWDVVLRAKTPLGGIYLGEDRPSARCNLTVVDNKGIITEKTISPCEYIYPHKVLSKCTDINTIKKAQQDLLDKGKPLSKLPNKFFKLNGLYAFWSCAEITSEEFGGSLSDSDKELASSFNLSCYGFFGHSTSLWDKYNDDLVGLRKDLRILKGGLQLAANSMPQGDLITIPLTKNIGYQQVTHVVAHFAGADPDLGRKGFQPEITSLAQEVAKTIVGKFLNYRDFLKKESGVITDLEEEKEVHEWIKKQEEHERNNPLRITREDVFLPGKEPLITSKPLLEQDVVALFNQLLAGGVIRGIKLMATSGHEQYDGVFKFFWKEPLEHHVFDKDKNPLGVERSNLNKGTSSRPYILEYKYSIDDLIEDFEKEEKSESQIKLIVAWEMGKNWKSRYQITSLLQFENLQHRPFHGVTHILHNLSTGDTTLYAIVLSELIEYVNNPVSVQDYQAKTYQE